MGWFSTKCNHDYGQERFQDLHTGGDGEIYVRSSAVCRECGHTRWFAVRLPKVVEEVLHENLNTATLERKDTDMRRQLSDALHAVFDNINRRAIMAGVNDVVFKEIKKAFDEN